MTTNHIEEKYVKDTLFQDRQTQVARHEAWTGSKKRKQQPKWYCYHLETTFLEETWKEANTFIHRRHFRDRGYMAKKPTYLKDTWRGRRTKKQTNGWDKPLEEHKVTNNLPRCKIVLVYTEYGSRMWDNCTTKPGQGKEIRNEWWQKRRNDRSTHDARNDVCNILVWKVSSSRSPWIVWRPN